MSKRLGRNNQDMCISVIWYIALLRDSALAYPTIPVWLSSPGMIYGNWNVRLPRYRYDNAKFVDNPMSVYSTDHLIPLNILIRSCSWPIDVAKNVLPGLATPSIPRNDNEHHDNDLADIFQVFTALFWMHLLKPPEVHKSATHALYKYNKLCNFPMVWNFDCLAIPFWWLIWIEECVAPVASV